MKPDIKQLKDDIYLPFYTAGTGVENYHSRFDCLGQSFRVFRLSSPTALFY